MSILIIDNSNNVVIKMVMFFMVKTMLLVTISFQVAVFIIYIFNL